MVTWSTAKASYLLLCNCKAHAPGPSHPCCMVYIFCAHRSECSGIWEGRGKGERVQTKHLNLIPLMVQLWEGNWDDFAVFQKLHSFPVLYWFKSMFPWPGSSQVSLSCLHSRPWFWIPTQQQLMLHFPPSYDPISHLLSQTWHTEPFPNQCKQNSANEPDLLCERTVE